MIDKADAEQHQENFKSILQQHAQQTENETPTYELLDEKGPDHNKCFEICVVLGRRRFTNAWGVTKKEAEQKAAMNALLEIGNWPPRIRSNLITSCSACCDVIGTALFNFTTSRPVLKCRVLIRLCPFYRMRSFFCLSRLLK